MENESRGKVNKDYDDNHSDSRVSPSPETFRKRIQVPHTSIGPNLEKPVRKAKKKKKKQKSSKKRAKSPNVILINEP